MSDTATFRTRTHRIAATTTRPGEMVPADMGAKLVHVPEVGIDALRVFSGARNMERQLAFSLRAVRRVHDRRMSGVWP